MDKIFDKNGNELLKNDFVMLSESKPDYISSIMKKGRVFKIDYWEYRNWGFGDEYMIAFLKSKTGSTKYSNGAKPVELIKVDYDIKKKKVTKIYN